MLDLEHECPRGPCSKIWCFYDIQPAFFPARRSEPDLDLAVPSTRVMYSTLMSDFLAADFFSTIPPRRRRYRGRISGAAFRPKYPFFARTSVWPCRFGSGRVAASVTGLPQGCTGAAARAGSSPCRADPFRTGYVFLQLAFDTNGKRRRRISTPIRSERMTFTSLHCS